MNEFQLKENSMRTHKKLLVLFGLLLSLNQQVLGASSEGSVDAPKLSQAIRMVQEGLYTAEIESGLWFVLEEQNADSIKGWQQYCEHQREVAERLKLQVQDCPPKQFEKFSVNLAGVECDFYKAIHQPEIRGTICQHAEVIHKFGQGLGALEHQLRYFEEGVLRQLWVAYAMHSAETPLTPCAGDNFKNVELTFAVGTDPEIPFTNHMGISKSVTYLEHHFGSSTTVAKPAEFPLHDHISTLLHAFAGNVMHGLFPQKPYMITTPMKVQKAMLVEALPLDAVWLADSAFYEGLEANDVAARAEWLRNVHQWEPGPANHCYPHGSPPTGIYSPAVQAVLDKGWSPITFGEMSYNHFRGDPTMSDRACSDYDKYKPEDFCFKISYKGQVIWDARTLAESSLAAGVEAPVLKWYLGGTFHDWSTGCGNSSAITILLSALAETFDTGLAARAERRAKKLAGVSAATA
jgi:hypothetical protein